MPRAGSFFKSISIGAHKSALRPIRKSAGHDADDLIFLAAQFDFFAERVSCSAKPPLPQAVTEYGDVIVSGLVFTVDKSAAHHWRGAEHGKEICLRQNSGDVLGFTGAA